MGIHRRLFLKGLAVTAAGVLAPTAGLADAEEVRRFWALDRTMGRPGEMADTPIGPMLRGDFAFSDGIFTHAYPQHFVYVDPTLAESFGIEDGAAYVPSTADRIWEFVVDPLVPAGTIFCADHPLGLALA